VTAHSQATLEELNKELKLEYEGRKQVLLKRLDVTLQSFLWSKKAEVCKLSSLGFRFETCRSQIHYGLVVFRINPKSSRMQLGLAEID
jgi:hypothetical protein